MSLVTVCLIYRNPISALVGARITSSAVLFQLGIGNEVTKPRIRRAEEVGMAKGGIPVVIPLRGWDLFWKFRECCKSFRGAMQYSNGFVVCGDSVDLSLVCRRYYGGVRRNVGMQGDTGQGVVIR